MVSVVGGSQNLTCSSVVSTVQVHPIFAISVADLMLALLWMVGGTVWLRRAPSRSWCFAISLPTVVSWPTRVHKIYTDHALWPKNTLLAVKLDLNVVKTVQYTERI